MIKLIRTLLQKCINDIDAGTSDISNDEAIEALGMLRKFTDKDRKFSKYQACQYLNVSRATFDNYVREGKLPKGKKEQGFKELFWQESILRDFVKQCKK